MDRADLCLPHPAVDRVFVFTGADLMFMFERRLNIATMIVSLGGGWSF